MECFRHAVDELVTASVILDPYQSGKIESESREFFVILGGFKIHGLRRLRFWRPFAKRMTDPCDHPPPWALCNFPQPCFVNHNVNIRFSRQRKNPEPRPAYESPPERRCAMPGLLIAQRRSHFPGRTRESGEIFESFLFPTLERPA